MSTAAFSTPEDERLARLVSTSLIKNLTNVLTRIIAAHHATTPDNSTDPACAECGKPYPCRTWRLATGEEQP